MKVSVFIAVSVDGFIAREDDSIDWLEIPNTKSDQDYGYREFIHSIDAILMGRNTFNVVEDLKDWTTNGMPIFVLTHHPMTLQLSKYKNAKAIQGEPVRSLLNWKSAVFIMCILTVGRPSLSFFLNL